MASRGYRSKYISLSLAWLLSAFTIRRSYGFNIETDYFVTHKGPIDSKFGFSLAQHKDAEGSWVLVGAPEAETQNPGVTKGGAVYKCHTQIEDHCEIILFDTKGNHYDGTQYIDEKSHQWFGASIASRGGIVAACAPRYVWYSVKKNRREPIGGCFLLTNDRGAGKFKAYSPCMTSSWGYHRQGTCQAGFGVALSQRGDKLYVGAVGSWYWQGQVFYQNLLNMQETLTTSEAPKQFDMSYMGFTLSMGNFDDDDQEDVAVGVPRGDNLKGMVVLLNHKLEVLYNLTGDQIGSYFGYSVAVLDFDGDGLDDVAVGAPWYTQMGIPSMLYEEGQVTLFKHTQQHNFKRIHRLLGKRSRSHFGLSLTSLKDINGDGYEDLAVGAPRDGEQERGGVYIFLGSATGLREQPAQVLFIEELTKVPIKTFGWALSGGLDLDGNEYPDLTVGAHDSNKAFVFRTRPVVTTDASVRIKSESGVFDLESLACSLQDSTDVPCYPIHYCVSYTGKGVPPQLKLLYSLRLDASSAEHSSRLFFLKNEGQAVFNSSLILHKDVPNCSSTYIYASPNLHDKLTPLVSELSFTLGDPNEFVNPLDLRPILAPPPFGQEPIVRNTIYFQNNCGDDNVCIPNLRGGMTLGESNYILGSSNNLLLDLHVSNRGEDAYGTRAYVKIPSGVHFSKFLVTYNGSPDDVTPFCTTVTKSSSISANEDDVAKNEESEESEKEYEKNMNGTEVIICEIGNPLPSGSGVGLQLHFQPSSYVMNYASLKFDLEANSTNPDRNETMEDNIVSVSLPVVMKSDVNIIGISWPDADFNYNASFFGKALLGPHRLIRHENEAGPEVAHIYDVVNRGPSDLPNVEIYLLWPTRTLIGDPLLYLTETPVVSKDTGFIHCDPVTGVNYLDLMVDSPSYDHFISPILLNSDNAKSRSVRRISEDLSSLQLFSENSSDSQPEENNKNLEELLSCGSTNCTIMKCFTPLLKADDNFVVRVRSRLWVDTIEKLGITDLKISSRLVVHSKGSLKNQRKKGLTWSENVTSIIKTRTETPVTSLSWLIWLGSAVAGLLVLALLILLLWMLGFFKRRRPQDEAENELIHRNGANGKL